MKQVSKVFRSGRKDIIEVTALLAVGILVISILLAIILKSEASDNFLPLNTALVFAIGGLMALLTASLEITVHMNRAVKFGIARKQALFGTILLAITTSFIWLVMVGVGFGMDLAINYLINPNVDFETFQDVLELIGIDEVTFALKFVGGSLLFFLIASLIMSMIVIKFGKKGFWAVYIICFGSTFFSTKIDGIMTSNSLAGNLIQTIATTLPAVAWWILGGLAVVAALVWAVKTALQLEVNNTFG